MEHLLSASGTCVNITNDVSWSIKCTCVYMHEALFNQAVSQDVYLPSCVHCVPEFLCPLQDGNTPLHLAAIRDDTRDEVCWSLEKMLYCIHNANACPLGLAHKG